MNEVNVSDTVGMFATVGEMSVTVGGGGICPQQWRDVRNRGGMSATVGGMSTTVGGCPQQWGNVHNSGECQQQWRKCPQQSGK